MSWTKDLNDEIFVHIKEMRNPIDFLGKSLQGQGHRQKLNLKKRFPDNNSKSLHQIILNYLLKILKF